MLKNDLELLLDVKIVNCIRADAKTKNNKIFSELCKYMEIDCTKLLFHTEARWLSRGKVLNLVLELKEQIFLFLTEETNLMAVKFRDTFWLAKLFYMASIFDQLNKLNLSQQSKAGDILLSVSKIKEFKLKLKTWKSKIEKCLF